MKAKTKAKQLKLGIAAIVCIIAISAMAVPASANYAGDHPFIVYEHEEIEGGLVYETVTDGTGYTVLPCKVYPQDPDYGLTQPITISIPECAEVKMARLYNYYTWSTSDNDTTTVPGVPAEAELTFNGVTVTCQNPAPITNPIDYGNGVIQYWDSKGQEYVSKLYDYPSGTFAWNVTDLVTGSGTYIAKIENADSTPTGMRSGYAYDPYKYRERFVTYGFGLLVVYELDDGEGPEVEYWISEGCDLLYASPYYGVTPEMATTEAVFADPEFEFEEDDIVSAELTTVVSASDKGKYNKNMVYFNDVEVGASTADDKWSIGLNSFGVLDLLSEVQNVCKIQDRRDYETARNAFLVVESPVPAEVRIEPETLNLNSSGNFTAFITLPDCYDVADINVSTVECEGAPAIDGEIIQSGDTLMVKFDREDLVGVEPGEEVEMTVTGEMVTGKIFEGSDTIRVIE